MGRDVYRIVTSHTGPGVPHTGSVILHISCFGEKARVVTVKLGEECYLSRCSSAHQLFWGRGTLQSSWVKNVICHAAITMLGQLCWMSCVLGEGGGGWGPCRAGWGVLLHH